MLREEKTREGIEKSGWFVTRVRPGFVDEPVKVAGRRVVEAAEDARDKMADLILGR